MKFNYVLGIYCYHCNRYYDPYIEVYINVLCEESVSCEKGHLLGYTWDLNWENFWRDE